MRETISVLGPAGSSASAMAVPSAESPMNTPPPKAEMPSAVLDRFQLLPGIPRDLPIDLLGRGTGEIFLILPCTALPGAVLPCAVLPCAVLPCAVLPCAVLTGTVLTCTVLIGAVLTCAVWPCVILGRRFFKRAAAACCPFVAMLPAFRVCYRMRATARQGSYSWSPNSLSTSFNLGVEAFEHGGQEGFCIQVFIVFGVHLYDRAGQIGQHDAPRRRVPARLPGTQGNLLRLARHPHAQKLKAGGILSGRLRHFQFFFRAHFVLLLRSSG